MGKTAASILLACATLVVLLDVEGAAQGRSGSAAEFFGARKVYVFHLTIDTVEWTKMTESIASMSGPGGFRPGGPPPQGQQGQFGPPPGGFIPRGGPQFGDPGGPWPRGRGPGAGPDIDPAPGVVTLEVDGQPWGRLTARFKGNSSLRAAINSIKKSFKLDFDDLDKNARFFGLAKLNLNNNTGDASAMRESLAYEVFREDGTVVPRTAYARLYLTVPGLYNRTYAGLYTVVEQVDQTFARDRFGAKVPMLLKPERQGGQPYRGEDWPAYHLPYGDKSETSAVDGQTLIALTKLLNQGSDEDFARHVGDYLDVDAFLHFLAVQAVLVNYDSPLGSGGNYYLALHPHTRKILFLPWDLNEAFGGFMAGAAPESMSVRQPSAPRQFLLADRVLAIDALRRRYETIAHTVVTANFTRARLGRAIASRASLLRDAIAGDPMIAPAEFERSLAENPAAAPPATGRGPGGRKPPLLEFVIRRAQAVLDELDGKVDAPVPFFIGGPGGQGRGPGRPPGP